MKLLRTMILKILLVFAPVFFLGSQCLAANISSGSNSEQSNTTEQSDRISKERSIDTSQSKRKQESLSKEKSENQSESSEKTHSIRNSNSTGQQYVNEFGMEALRIVEGLVRSASSLAPQSPLSKQIESCSIYSNPCVPTFSHNALMGTYDPYQNSMVKTRHDQGVACNQWNSVTQQFGDHKIVVARNNDLMVRTASCYALNAYAVEATLARLSQYERIETSSRHEFEKKAQQALLVVLERDTPNVMHKAISFGKRIIGQECRIPTAYGYASKSISEWHCGGLKISAYDVIASYQGASLLGGSDLLGQTYQVTMRLDRQNQTSFDDANSFSNTSSKSLEQRTSSIASTERQNNTSMRRSSSTEQSKNSNNRSSSSNDTTATNK